MTIDNNFYIVDKIVYKMIFKKNYEQINLQSDHNSAHANKFFYTKSKYVRITAKLFLLEKNLSYNENN